MSNVGPALLGCDDDFRRHLHLLAQVFVRRAKRLPRARLQGDAPGKRGGSRGNPFLEIDVHPADFLFSRAPLGDLPFQGTMHALQLR